MQRLRFANPLSLLVTFCIATAIGASAQNFSRQVFHGKNGANPYGPLVQGLNGNFYGTTIYGGPSFGSSQQAFGSGTVFELTPTGKVTTLYNFCSQLNGKICADGQLPASGLVLARNGDFYGTTLTGGPGNAGTVFEITPSGKLTTIYTFCSQSCSDGALPNGMVQGVDGNFYGTTQSGGAGAYGTVFVITPAGKLTVLHSFDSTHGGVPAASLVQASNGGFYGIVADGGINNCLGGCGMVFGITPTGQFEILHAFCSVPTCPDGYSPEGPLIQGSDGNLYGTTVAGGAAQEGTAFKLTLDGQLTTLYNFCSVIDSLHNCVDGDFPTGGLVQATDGNFYGTSDGGGDEDGGIIFEMTPAGALTILHTFCPTIACVDGSRPMSGLIQATNGTFYGTTDTGGDNKDCWLNPDGRGCGNAIAVAVGLTPFVRANPAFGKSGWSVNILGNNLVGASVVTFNGIPANFAVPSNTYIKATVPDGATSGTIEVVTPSGTLSGNVVFQVLP